MNITNSTLSGNVNGTSNQQSTAGAIYANGGAVNITNSTLSGNSALSQQNEARGGAIGESNATMNIVNSTVSGNTANGSHADAIGGGIIATGGTINFINSIMTGTPLVAPFPTRMMAPRCGLVTAPRSTRPIPSSALIPGEGIVARRSQHQQK